VRLIEYRLFSLVDLGLQQPRRDAATAFAFLYWFLPNASASLADPRRRGDLCRAGPGYLSGPDRQISALRRYSGNSPLPLLFVWIYLFWAVVLFGASRLAYDNLPLWREVGPRRRAPRQAIGLHRAGGGAGLPRPRAVWTADALAGRSTCRANGARGARGPQRAGVVATRGAVEKGVSARKSGGTIPVTAVVRALRGVREKATGDPGWAPRSTACSASWSRRRGRRRPDLGPARAASGAQGEACLMRIYLDLCTTPVRGGGEAMAAALRGASGIPSVHAEGGARPGGRAREAWQGCCPASRAGALHGRCDRGTTRYRALLRAWAATGATSWSTSSTPRSRPLAALERESWRVTRLRCRGLLEPAQLASSVGQPW
jgi:hypothetical protein